MPETASARENETLAASLIGGRLANSRNDIFIVLWPDVPGNTFAVEIPGLAYPRYRVTVETES